MRAIGLRVEDVLLAGWNAAGVPLLAAGSLSPIVALGDEPNTVAGVIQLVAIAGAIIAIATRPSGMPPEQAKLVGELRIGFMGPLVGAVAFVSGSASTYLGFGVDGLAIGTAFLAIVGAMLLGDRLPVMDAGLRRALILPFIGVSAGIFNGFAADVLDGLDVAELLTSLTVDQTGFGVFIVTMLVAGLGFFYAALVVAPRTLVAPEDAGGCLVWPMRFALYLVSAVFGIGWLAVIAG
jgi:hypothetical protein